MQIVWATLLGWALFGQFPDVPALGGMAIIAGSGLWLTWHERRRVLATADQYAAKQAVFGIDTALKALSEHKKQADLSGVVETPCDLVTK